MNEEKAEEKNRRRREKERDCITAGCLLYFRWTTANKMEKRLMRRYLIIALIIVVLCSCMNKIDTVKNPGQDQPGSKTIIFNRLSLEIPEDWKYSTNPKAVPGTDQIQLYSADTLRSLLITLTNARDDITIEEAVTQGGITLVGRATSIPEFSGCSVEGSGQEPYLWGRKGTVVSFNLVKESQSDGKSVVMKIYNMGEELDGTKEVLFISAFIIGEEKGDLEKIVRSIKILAK